MHAANGVYGLILVEPPEGLSKVDHEYYVMQGDFYTTGKYRKKGLQPFDMERAIGERPTYVLFNGAEGALTGDKAITAKDLRNGAPLRRQWRTEPGVELLRHRCDLRQGEVLKRMADERRVDGARWTLARIDATSVRKLAAVLGIQYRALADGEFNHTTAVFLVDAEGDRGAPVAS